MSAGAQATVIFSDGFENGTVGSVPTTTDGGGSWSSYDIGTGPYNVLAISTGVIAAREGVNYLGMYRGDAATQLPRLTGTPSAATNTGDTIAMSLSSYMWAGECSLMFYASDNTLLTQFGFWKDSGVSIVDNTDNWRYFTASAPGSQWNDMVITHTNGSQAWTLSVNGGTAEALDSYAAGLTKNIGYFKFQIDSSGGDAGFDAVSVSIVPEPSMFVLLGVSVVSLLAYAWRKRR